MVRTIVTGASGGIGQAIVEKLIERGDEVVGVDQSPPVVQSDRYLHIRKTLKSEADAFSVVEQAAPDGQQIFNLINCAAIIGTRTELWRVQRGEFEEIVQNNLFSTYWMCKAICPHFIDYDYGRIVNFGAIAGKDGSAKSSHYAASKAAIISLTKALGKELATYRDILCNCVTPAAVETNALLEHSEEDIRQHLSKIPKGRFCQPEEVAELVCWLSSDKCSFSTGAVFDISGGRATY